jgi:hypothetical protein
LIAFKWLGVGCAGTDVNPADDEWAEPHLAATADTGYVTGASLTIGGGPSAANAGS